METLWPAAGFLDAWGLTIGWSKKVLAERDDGKHEWLNALYFCRTHVEAITLQSYCSPTHLKRGSESIMRHDTAVYSSESGRMYVVFDWRTSENFVPIYLYCEF